MNKTCLTIAAAGALALGGLLLADPAGAAPVAKGGCPPGAPAPATWGASWMTYPAIDPIPGFDRGALVDRNRDGLICAWTPRGLFNPADLSPWVVVDNHGPVR